MTVRGDHMTKEEREHLSKLKNWATESRKAWEELKKSPIWATLERLTPQGTKAETLFDNVDWLIAVLERDDKLLRHRQGVRALKGALQQ